MKLDFPKLLFKGTRNYLQGPDIFNALIDSLQSFPEVISNLDVSFHRLSSHQLQLCDEEPDSCDLVAACRYTVGSLDKTVYLKETIESVVGSYLYDEDNVIDGLLIDEQKRSASLMTTSEYTMIETWVAMVKALHLRAFSGSKGKWLFVRAKFKEYKKYHSPSINTVKISSSFGVKLTRTEVFRDDIKLGEIFFSLSA